MLRAQTFTIESHGAALFGAGIVERIPGIVTALHQERAFIVTDPGVSAAGVSGRVEEVLTRAGFEVGVFDGVHPNPGVEHLEAGGRAIRAFGEAAVIALGGGAVLDVAKGLALMAVNPGSARDFDYRREPERIGLPLVAVPTTAGTGSETNAFGVIDDPDAGRKFYVGHRSVLPRAVVLDPELTRGLPPGPTAAGGIDALAHALESLSSIRSNPYAEGLNLRVVQMVSRYLPRAVAHGDDLEARAELLIAAHMAGLAFATTGLGLAHAVGHALSARFHTPHGVALAVLLPHVLAFNLPVRQEVYAQVAVAMGERASGNEANQAQSAIAAVRRLSSMVGMPSSLSELGCTRAQIPSIARDALADEVLVNTPRPPGRAELTELLYHAM